MNPDTLNRKNPSVFSVYLYNLIYNVNSLYTSKSKLYLLVSESALDNDPLPYDFHQPGRCHMSTKSVSEGQVVAAQCSGYHMGPSHCKGFALPLSAYAAFLKDQTLQT